MSAFETNNTVLSCPFVSASSALKVVSLSSPSEADSRELRHARVSASDA